jgi:hypothetical protein
VTSVHGKLLDATGAGGLVGGRGRGEGTTDARGALKILVTTSILLYCVVILKSGNDSDKLVETAMYDLNVCSELVYTRKAIYVFFH